MSAIGLAAALCALGPVATMQAAESNEEIENGADFQTLPEGDAVQEAVLYSAPAGNDSPLDIVDVEEDEIDDEDVEDEDMDDEELDMDDEEEPGDGENDEEIITDDILDDEIIVNQNDNNAGNPPELPGTPEPETGSVVGRGANILKAGIPYRLGDGKWRVDGDSTIYYGNGSRTFYVSGDGTYQFTDFTVQ